MHTMHFHEHEKSSPGLRLKGTDIMSFCRYHRIDFLYLNAGIMPNPQVNVKAFLKGLFSR